LALNFKHIFQTLFRQTGVFDTCLSNNVTKKGGIGTAESVDTMDAYEEEEVQPHKFLIIIIIIKTCTNFCTLKRI